MFIRKIKQIYKIKGDRMSSNNCEEIKQDKQVDGFNNAAKILKASFNIKFSWLEYYSRRRYVR